METYKIASKNLRCFVEVKVLTGAQQKELVDNLAKTVKEFPPSTSLVDYYKHLVKELVVNSDSIVESVKNNDFLDSNNGEDAYIHLYKCVVNLYKFFSIESICNYSNNNIFLKINKDDLAMVEGFGPVLKSANPDLFKDEDLIIIPSKSLDDIKQLELNLKTNIIGQDETIDNIIKYVKLRESGLNDFFTLFLIGKSGVGKTLVPELLAKFYTDDRIIKLDCASLTNGNEKATLFGAPPGYIGHKPKSLLAEKAAISNNWVFLFDEIEKADDVLLDNLLGLLDKGMVRDSNGEELDFTHSIFIFTSNYGIEYDKEVTRIGLVNTTTTKIQTKSEVLDKVKSKFRMEFLNRIDDIIILNNLTKKDCLKIASLELGVYPLNVTNRLLNYVVDNAFSTEFGARNLKRFIKSNIGLPLAEFILTNKITDSSLFNVKITKTGVKISLHSLNVPLTEPLPALDPALTLALQ